MDIQIIGFTWYKEEQYNTFKDHFEDDFNLPDTFKTWFTQAEKGYKRLKAQGYSVHKVEVDISDFMSWCALHDHKPNSEGRNAFVTWKVNQGLNASIPSPCVVYE